MGVITWLNDCSCAWGRQGTLSVVYPTFSWVCACVGVFSRGTPEWLWFYLLLPKCMYIRINLGLVPPSYSLVPGLEEPAIHKPTPLS